MRPVSFEVEEYISVDELIDQFSKAERKEALEILLESNTLTDSVVTPTESDLLIALERIRNRFTSLSERQRNQILSIASTL